MSLVANIQLLAQRISAECKSLRTLINGNAADLSALTTVNKTNLVAAINELQGLISTIPSTQIDDLTTSTTKVWSSSKTNQAITDAIDALINGAPAALDTLKEIADQLANDQSVVAALTAAVANRVRFDAPQTLTTAQQAQACSNIGVGDPETDFVAVFNAGLL